MPSVNNLPCIQQSFCHTCKHEWKIGNCKGFSACPLWKDERGPYPSRPYRMISPGSLQGRWKRDIEQLIRSRSRIRGWKL
ncbi:hypothetical protein I7I50_05356 [Histoplasma capsulatum G186AR]|uniref:Uncharacterized protein n=1 Tax=Ajellomyces capsulatus TaxID=5037 RepID=A0A8H8D7P7_AJECA|nr:hypothetical protein I7I52_03617 [Histoplasma capsulatum]QSS76034.1 hypothetical protein I7I50_05356 [Histoplasma capsulatum G186AR]